MTPQAPAPERPQVEPSATPTPPPYPPPYSPPPWQPAYRPAPAPAPSPVESATPSAGQRLALAIVSLALLIPLVAIALNFAGDFAPVWLSVLTGLISVALLSLVVVGVNMIFNWDVLLPRR